MESGELVLPSKTAGRARGLVEVLTYVVIACAVLWFGGAWERWQWSSLVVLAAIVGAGAIACMRRSDARHLAVPLVLLGMLAAIHAAQLMPLPQSLPWPVAPGRMAVEESFGVAAVTGGFWRTPSMDSSATVDSLLLLAAYVAAFVTGVSIFGTRTRFVRLAAVLAAVAIAASAMGLGELSATGVHHAGRLSGSYANPNRFCDLLALALGATVAAAVVLGGSWVSKLDRDVFGRLARRAEPRWVLVAAAVALQLAALATLSRLGVVSIVLAGAAAAALAGSREALAKRMGTVAAVTAVIVLVNVSLVAEPAVAKFSALFEPGPLAAGRLRCWWHALGIPRDFPVLGAGAGSFTSVFAAYQEPGLIGHFRYPHSEAVGVLCEFGIAGAAAVFAAAALLAMRVMRALSSGMHRAARAAPGLFLGLGAVGLHSLGDYGLRVPATGFVFFLLAGAAWRLLAKGPPPEEAEAETAPRALILRIATAALFAVAAWWAAWSAAGGRVDSTPAPEMTVFADSAVTAELERSARAVALCPRVPDARYRRARALWMETARTPVGERSRDLLAEARAELLTSLRTRPVDAPALHMLAMVEEALGYQASADRAAMAAARAALAYPAVQLNVAKMLAARAAEEAYAAREARAPVEDAEWHKARGLFLKAEATAALERAAASSEARGLGVLRYAAQVGFEAEELEKIASAAGVPGMLSLAKVFLETGRAEFALDLLGRTKSRGGLARGEQAELEFLTGTALLVTGEVSLAGRAFRRQLQLSPPAAADKVVRLHARAFARAGRAAEGVAYLKSLEEDFGGYGWFHAEMGDLARKLHKPEGEPGPE